MTSIKLSKVGFDLPHRELFRNINLNLGSGRQALVGFNGVGKTTLAKILTGEVEPTTGDVERHGPVILFRQTRSLADHLAEFASSRSSLRARLHSIEEVLGRTTRPVALDWRKWFDLIPRRDDVTTLSGGELMRLRLLETLGEVVRREEGGKPVLLVLDEPTNDLDREGRELVRDWILARRHGLLLISHDRELLESVDEIFELSSKGLRSYGGGYSAYHEGVVLEREREAQTAREADRNLKKTTREAHDKISRQEKRMRRGKRDGEKGGMPRILLGARKRAAERTQARLSTNETKRVEGADEARREASHAKRLDPFVRLDFKAEARPASQVLVRAENLQLRRGTPWERPLHFQIRARDRLWLQGGNGTGKSSLLKVIMGEGRETTGELWRSPLIQEKDRIGFLDQKQSGLNDEDTVFESIERSTRFGFREIRNELAFYGFTNESVRTRVSNLSGGERLRLALAKIFLGVHLPALLILDEPTNNLDFSSLDLLERAVQRFSGGILLVTHDETFGAKLEDFHSWRIVD